MSTPKRLIPLIALLALLGGAGLTLVQRVEAQRAEETGASPAQRAFDRLKALEGEWRSKSTRGWTGSVRYQTIAGGTVVLAVSEIGPHAGTQMATAYHLDGDRLMLTHYCVAGNQPRLEAQAISEDGRSLRFAFRDGTNLASRDVGHMDSVQIELPSADRFTSRWTWFQDGNERWLEEIDHSRVP